MRNTNTTVIHVNTKEGMRTAGACGPNKVTIGWSKSSNNGGLLYWLKKAGISVSGIKATMMLNGSSSDTSV